MDISIFRIQMITAIACLLLVSVSAKASTLFENFDNPSVSSNNNSAKDITYPSGVWNVCAITNPTNPNENDRINGLYSMRMRGLAGQNFMFMKFDKAGAGVLSFKYGSFSNHSNGEFTVEQSTNQGLSWVPVGLPVLVPKWSGTFLTYAVPINFDGNIRFRIVMTLRTPNNPNEQVNIDDFMITGFGTSQVAMPRSNVPTGIYETPQTLVLSSTTADATIYYTTDGSTPTTASNVYTTPLNISTTTTIRMFAVAAAHVDSREEVVLISFPEEVATLAEFYTKMASTGTNRTFFKYTGEAIVTASYTATFKTLFFQDNTAGMLLSDNHRYTVLTHNVGDKVTGIIAQVNRINDSPQLYPYNDFTIISTGNTLNPPLVTLADVPNRTNQLVQINDLSFTEANGTRTFSPNTPYAILDESVTSTTTTFRTPSNMPNPDYINTIIPAKRNISCIVAKNSSSVATHYVFARNAADLNVSVSSIHSLNTLKIYTSNTNVYFETYAPETVKVYRANGQLVTHFISSVGRNSLNLSQGLYIVRVGDQVTKVVL